MSLPKIKSVMFSDLLSFLEALEVIQSLYPFLTLGATSTLGFLVPFFCIQSQQQSLESFSYYIAVISFFGLSLPLLIALTIILGNISNEK